MNQYLDLEFIQKPIISHISISGFLILLASFWLGVFTWQTHSQQQVKLAEITNSLQTINQQFPQQEMIKPVIAPVSSKQITQLMEDFKVLATPWNELLDSIEQSDMPDIALLGMDPNVKKQQVILTGEAKNLATILQYINKLSLQTMLSQVVLQKHVVNETVNEKPVSFSIIAKWDNARFGAPK